jgi:hypothetical protein
MAAVIMSRGDFTQTVDRVKAVIACYVFCVAGDSVAHVNRGPTQSIAVQEIFTSRLLRC